MKGEAKERWKHLCELAADEQDPEKMLALITEINRLLEEKEQRLIRLRSGNGSASDREKEGLTWEGESG